MQAKYEVLLWIGLAGAFGGFVDGLMSERHYSFRWGKTIRDLGSIGDCLVGATAGIAIFSVAGSLLKVDFTAMTAPEEFIRVIALGVLSGFAGIRLLQPLTEELVKRFASEEAQKKFKGLVTESVATSIDINLANGCITNYEATKRVPTVKDEERQKILVDAEKAIERALQREPTNVEALRVKAKIFKRQAELKKDSKDKIPLYKGAIDLTSRMIDIHPESDVGYYAKACYQSLLRSLDPNIAVSAIIESLSEAINRSQHNKQRAKDDPDFDSIKREAAFMALTDQNHKAFAATSTR